VLCPWKLLNNTILPNFFASPFLRVFPQVCDKFAFVVGDLSLLNDFIKTDLKPITTTTTAGLADVDGTGD
jgi:hypothetical protein